MAQSPACRVSVASPSRRDWDPVPVLADRSSAILMTTSVDAAEVAARSVPQRSFARFLHSWRYGLPPPTTTMMMMVQKWKRRRWEGGVWADGG